MFVLDTNVLSELRLIAAGRGNPRVAEWASRHDEKMSFISILTLFEIEVGTQRMERRDPRQGAVLRQWVDLAVVPQFHDRTLPLTDAIIRLAASFHVPNPAPMADSLIAATAVVHGMVVVTRNAADFGFAGVRVLDPWAG